MLSLAKSTIYSKALLKIDEDMLAELEETLICADVGIATTEIILIAFVIVTRWAPDRGKTGERVLSDIISEMIGEGEPLDLSNKPAVILIIGVNGVGKTTSIGKIAKNLTSQGKNVIVAASDTFRAAAIDQLAVWCERAGTHLIRHSEGSDPAAVVFDAAAAARKRGADVLMVDTAGRLHNKKNLMEELAKINRVLSRELPESSRETLLVLMQRQGKTPSFRQKNLSVQPI